MSLHLDARQKTMLEHMGLRLDFLPSTTPDDSTPETLTTPAQRPATAPGHTPAQPSAQQAPALRPPNAAPSVTPARVPQAHKPVRATETIQAANLGPRPDVAQADWSTLQAEVQACTACALCQTRHQTVFGVGADPQGGPVDWMIVGEAPGEQEDLLGEPFVGPAGQLLDQMLAAVGLSRQPAPEAGRRVFIANVLKCRPPGNRNPQPEEVAQCLPFLERQIELLRPKALLAMGKFGAQALLAAQLPEVASMPLGKLRGQIYRYGEIPLVVTYHPAYLLRTPADKAKAWADLCQAHAISHAA